LTLANTWDKNWPHIRKSVEDKLGKEAKKKYIALDKKLNHLTQAQGKTPQNPHTIHPRLINNTAIHFSKSETTLLQKSLKYNLLSKPKHWIQNLALEAETAIALLPPSEREVYRKITANRIVTLQKQHPSPSKHPETRTIKSIQAKLRDNKATITRDDKGNFIVILPTYQYENKIGEFLNNSFRIATTDPTTTFQTKVKKTIQSSKTLIPKDHRWRYTNMNPSALSFKGLVKINKQDQPIRPVVHWRNAPAYYISKLFTKKINRLSPLPQAFKIKNTLDHIRKLQDTPILPHHTLTSLDITNLYSNIPVLETTTILANILKQNPIDPTQQQEILNWYDVITQQIYFSHNKQIIVQQDGLAMGAPSSGLIAEIFL
jgi:hypothetical protein